MPMTKDQLLTEALKLDYWERDTLIEELRDSMHDVPLKPEQIAEVRRRVAEIDRGEVEMVDGKEAMRVMLEKLRSR